jgi:alpha-L-arabinofuranosidase
MSVVAAGVHIVAGCRLGAHVVSPREDDPTVVSVSDRVILSRARRLGVNLGGEAYYGSLQILKNLVSRNPGFEGQQWQSILQCGHGSGAGTCVDVVGWSRWPEGFLDGFSFEVLSGAAAGTKGTVAHSGKPSGTPGLGAEVRFATPVPGLAAGDYVVVRGRMDGSPAFGWHVQADGEATVTNEQHDLSPHTPGKQAVRLKASRVGQTAGVTEYFDSTPGWSYVQMRGPYILRFRAKGILARDTLNIRLTRIGGGAREAAVFEKPVALDGVWKDYALHFAANEPQSASGTMALTLNVTGGEVLLDDVSLEEATDNGTAFRDSVVEALERLQPGILRWMDSGQNWGSSLDNMLAVQYARKPAGFSPGSTEPADMSVGLHDFLVLCRKIGAEPWFTIPMGTSEQDTARLMEYLGGPPQSGYGAVRARLGQKDAWTKEFATIHLEFGNETWNLRQHGAVLPAATAYPLRASTIAHRIRSSPWYQAGHFDLIANGQEVNPWLTGVMLKSLEGFDTIDFASYTFDPFRDASSSEAIYGPMLAEPEMLVHGVMRKQVEAAAHALHPAHVAVYEENIGTVDGTVTQADLDATIPSLGAGLSTIDEMLLLMRDLGVNEQCLFQLTGNSYNFTNERTHDSKLKSPVWAMVVDLGGQSDRVRPVFLAEEMANRAILPSMLETVSTGPNPTWHQPLSQNSAVELERAHELQSFAFTDGRARTLILLNLSRTEAHSVRVEGPGAPRGAVNSELLTSARISDGNQTAEQVRIARRAYKNFDSGNNTVTLPPFSMTVLKSSMP